MSLFPGHSGLPVSISANTHPEVGGGVEETMVVRDEEKGRGLKREKEREGKKKRERWLLILR